MNDLFLELLRAGVLVLLLIYLLVRGRNTRCATLPGTRLLVAGFGLLLFAALFDVTDEIPGLERFVFIGATEIEAYIETLCGYLPAYFLLFLGFIKIVPALNQSLEDKEDLRESEERFRSFFETIPDVVGITRLHDGKTIDLNPAFEELTSIPRTQMIGRSSLETSVWANPADRDLLVKNVLEKGMVRNFEARFKISGGEIRDSLVSARLLTLKGEPHLLEIYKDITERNQVMQALEESEEKFRLIFEGVPDPIVIARVDGSGILDVNQAFVRETGISREEALGETSATLNLWVDSAQRDLLMEQLRRDGVVTKFESLLRRKTGEVVTCLLSAQIVDIAGTPCMLLINRDITSEKQAETALREMDRMKSEFISTAAHELRTPLTAILGYSELLIDNHFYQLSEEKRAAFLQEIFNKSELLSSIIEDMLDISRIESGHPIALTRKTSNPAIWLEEVLHPFELRKGDHSFQLDLSGPQPESLSFDCGRLSQVLENLLSNAVKYSPHGGTITVGGRVDNIEYVITVADQGIGMTPEQLSRVFDKFWRADTSNTAIDGLGLGMSIARQIIELHGGRIWVESTPGSGTRASFSLPLTPTS